jgi:hypothetical protein
VSRPRKFVPLQLLFGQGERIARRGDLAFDFGDRAYKLAVALDQRQSISRMADSAGLCDLAEQPAGVGAQPLAQAFELGEIVSPFLAFPAIPAQKVFNDAHSAAPGGACWINDPPVDAHA